MLRGDPCGDPPSHSARTLAAPSGYGRAVSRQPSLRSGSRALFYFLRAPSSYQRIDAVCAPFGRAICVARASPLLPSVALGPPCAPRRGSVSSLPLLDVRSSGLGYWRAAACTCVLVPLCLRGFAPCPSCAGVGCGSPPAPSFAWGSPRPHARCPLPSVAPSLAVGLRDSGLSGGLRSLPAVGRSARPILFALPSVGLSFPIPSPLPSVAAMGWDPSFGMGPSMRPPCGRSGWRVGWVRYAPTLSLPSPGVAPSVRASLVPCGVLLNVPYLRLRAPPLATLAGYCGRSAPTKIHNRC